MAIKSVCMVKRFWIFDISFVIEFIGKKLLSSFCNHIKSACFPSKIALKSWLFSKLPCSSATTLPRFLQLWSQRHQYTTPPQQKDISTTLRHIYKNSIRNFAKQRHHDTMAPQQNSTLFNHFVFFLYFLHSILLHPLSYTRWLRNCREGLLFGHHRRVSWPRAFGSSPITILIHQRFACRWRLRLTVAIESLFQMKPILYPW